MKRRTAPKKTATNIGLAWSLFNLFWDEYRRRHTTLGVTDADAERVLKELPEVVKNLASQALQIEDGLRI